MQALAPLLLAQIAPDASLAPVRADYAYALGALVLVALIPHYVAAKMLAEERATIPRMLAALSIQVLLATLLLGTILSGVSVALSLLASLGLPLLVGICLLVLSVATGAVYGFGVVKGFLYNIGTAAVMWGIFQVIFVALDPMPLRKVLFALELQRQGARQEKNAAPADGEPQDTVADRPTPAEEKANPADPKPVHKFASAEEARAAALKKYPALGVPGSAFNRRFVELHTQLKTTMPGLVSGPEWPMTLADQVAAELGEK